MEAPSLSTPSLRLSLVLTLTAPSLFTPSLRDPLYTERVNICLSVLLQKLKRKVEYLHLYLPLNPESVLCMRKPKGHSFLYINK